MFWYGGPDVGIGIISPDDQTREKRDFYAKVNTRELLIVDRDPRALEFSWLSDGQLRPVGKSTLDSPDVLASDVVPLSFQWRPGDVRPTIEVRHSDGVQNWSI